MNINREDRDELANSIVDSEVQKLAKAYGPEITNKILRLSSKIVNLISANFNSSIELHEAIQLVGRISYGGKKVAASEAGLSIDEMNQEFKKRNS